VRRHQPVDDPGPAVDPTRRLRRHRRRPHGVELAGEELFFSHVGVRGGPAPVRRFLPELIELVCNREIEPGKVFDLTLPLDQASEGYRAMDERRTIRTLLRP
jgi:threonine dehydrogenase-like Zn-dependent dehydrogenase